MTADGFEEFCFEILPDIIQGTTRGTSSINSNGTSEIVISSEVLLFKKSVEKFQSNFLEINGQIPK